MKDINPPENECLIRSMTYTLHGDPIALARARFGNAKVYDSQKQHKLICGLELRRQHGDFPLFTGPLQLTITFYMGIPQKRKKLCGCYHACRPDTSNLIKFIEDVASNGILYKDDALIAVIQAQKVYSDEPRTEFTITALGEI